MNCRWVVAIAAVACVALLGSAVLVHPGDAGARQLPARVLQGIAVLQKAWEGEEVWHAGEPAALDAVERKAADHIAVLIGYADEDTEHGGLLAERCRTRLRVWIAGPGAAEEQGVDYPGHPPLAEAYLLARLAALRLPDTSPRPELDALRDAAMGYVQSCNAEAAKHDPEVAKRVGEAGKYEVIGIFVGTAELLSCCDRALAELYMAEGEVDPPAAAEIVDEYWKWRKARMLERRRSSCPPMSDMPKALEYLDRLVEALPEE